MYNYKTAAAEFLSKSIDSLTVSQIADMLEFPPDKKMGDLALPCFKLSRVLRKAPPMIADGLKADLDGNEDVKKIFKNIESVSGYLNFFIDEATYCETLKDIVADPDKYGSNDMGKGKNVVIDYSSPNVAKPFHIGHLRSTVIGQSIKNLFRFSGYTCTGVNHLGDWGTQFGKLIVAYKKWGSKEDIEARGIKALNEIYVKFHKEAENDKALDDEAREAFAKLEQHDEECYNLWKWFIELSIAEYKKTYALIGAEFESWLGESFYFDKAEDIVKELREKNLLTLDDGAHIVKLDDYNMPPCLILKSDGSTIYATRDIAAAMYRKNTYDFEKCIYVTSAGQSLHFAQFFKVIGLMGYDWEDKLVHVPFGTVSIAGTKLSTREGNVVLLEDIFAEAISKTLEIMNEKNPNLEDKEEIAKAVGVGAVIFHDLSNNRIKDVSFVWDEVLNFEGNTGPYVQYTYARCAGITDKADHKIDTEKLVITSEFEADLLRVLHEFPNKVNQAREELEPSVISRYLLDVCQSFNRFYHDCPVLKAEDEKIRNTRIALVSATAAVLKNGLSLICLKTPKNI
ncbi:MAG: arginine--tRNA ligase [Ruminococcaceae bacterium]|nr:arginine--tRNA ligase [Oscillospiraceae bacterium]